MKMRAIIAFALLALSTVLLAIGVPSAIVGCGGAAPVESDAVADAGTDAAAHDSGSTDASDASDASDSGTVSDASDAGLASDASDSGTVSGASDAGLASVDASDSRPTLDASNAGSAPDGGDSGSLNAGIENDSGLGSAHIRQWQSFTCDGNCPPEGNSNNEVIWGTLQPVLAGSTIVVFVTEADNGDMTAPPVTVSDSAGDSYTELNEVNDQPDQQANWMFVTKNVAATGRPLQVSSTFHGVNQWQGIIVMEIAGTGPLSVIGSSSNVIFNDCCGSPGSLPDVFPSIALTAPSLVIAVSDGFDILQAGSGYTVLGSAWDWMGDEGACNCNSTTIEYGTFPVGSAAPRFVPIEPRTNYMNLAVAIQSN